MVEFVIGIFVGGLLFWLFIDRKKTSGTFTIDLDSPAENEAIRLNFTDRLNDIAAKKRIVLDVKVLGDDSLN